MIQITDLVDKISQLEISGVRVRDMDQIPYTINSRDCPIMLPEPLNFIQSIELIIDSFGTPDIAKMTIKYQLNYTFCFCPVGEGRELAEYGNMVKKVFAILDVFIRYQNMSSNTDFDEVVDVAPVGVTEFGPVSSPDGGQFLGCKFQFMVTEFIN